MEPILLGITGLLIHSLELQAWNSQNLGSEPWEREEPAGPQEGPARPGASALRPIFTRSGQGEKRGCNPLQGSHRNYTELPPSGGPRSHICTCTLLLGGAVSSEGSRLVCNQIPHQEMSRDAWN